MKYLEYAVFFLGLVSPSAFALPFCLQGSDGMKCWYQTEAACEAIKSEHEFCIINPIDLDVKEQKLYLRIPEFSEGLCLGPVCVKYSQEVCNEEERRVNHPLKCEVDPSP